MGKSDVGPVNKPHDPADGPTVLAYVNKDGSLHMQIVGFDSIMLVYIAELIRRHAGAMDAQRAQQQLARQPRLIVPH